MRKALMLLAVLVICTTLAFSQVKTITGRIVDQSGAPVPFVTIHIKESKQTVSADAEGGFAIKAEPSQTLVITGTGFATKEIKVGDQTSLTIQMSKKESNLTEVVVTALGIKQEKKALGYATQQVSGASLVQADATNTLSGLGGKVAGLQISSSTGTPGAATYMRLRGVTSLVAGQPLIVVDGVPIDNSNTGVSLGNVAQSNRAIDINPDDIENVSVIKGPAAATMYGTQGSDGVILITTKRGGKARSGNRFDITYSANFTFDEVNKLPELQMKYSQGYNGLYNAPNSSASGRRLTWGALIDTLKWDGVATEWDPHGSIVGASNPAGKTKVVPYNNAKQFFRTAFSQTHNLSLSGGNDFSSYRFSFSNLASSGIIPVSSFNRTTFLVSGDTRLSDKLKTGATVNYIVSGGNRVQEGSNTSGIMLGLMRTPTTFDNSNGVSDPKNTKAFLLSDGNQRTFRGEGSRSGGKYDNPYWTINRNPFRDKVQRILANAYLSYDPYSWLNITERIGVDHYGDDRFQSFAISSNGHPTGQIDYTDISNTIYNNDLLVTMTHNLTDDLKGTLLLGNNLYFTEYNQNNLEGDGYVAPDYYSLANTSSQLASNSYQRTSRLAFNAQAKFDYKGYLFVDGGIRAEKSSTFISYAVPYPSFVYFPSAGASFIFSDAFNMTSKAFSYGKLRFSYGQAGRLPGIYGTTNTFAGTSVVGLADGWTSGISFPINGQQAVFGNGLGNANLKPERTSSIDIGTELRFLENRLGLDVTYYVSKSHDLLLSVPISPSSGYGSYYTNGASMENHGLEVVLNATPVKAGDFRWDMNINWSFNRSKVTALAPGVSTYTITGFTGALIENIVGQPYGIVYGTDFLRDSKGNLIVSDGQDGTPAGYPIAGTNSIRIGNPNPKWIGGWQNTFSYKGFTLGALFETKQKFDVWNGTKGAMTYFGTAKVTENRGTSYTFQGVLGHADDNGNAVVTGGANKTPVLLDQSWYSDYIGNSFTGPAAQSVEDGTYVRLREVSLGYTFNTKSWGTHNFIKSLTVTAIGRNLWLHTKYSGVDPDTGLGGSAGLGIDYFNNPGTRTFGFNVKVGL
ncbi:MAG: SusC/RagA family TonB-linked outer membrane protein [Sphingobacteriales bacterium]|nr:SusC/RagA family TonB-linked outer membrane protein [Sphingobacteriales bacterium]